MLRGPADGARGQNRVSAVDDIADIGGSDALCVGVDAEGPDALVPRRESAAALQGFDGPLLASLGHEPGRSREGCGSEGEEGSEVHGECIGYEYESSW